MDGSADEAARDEAARDEAAQRSDAELITAAASGDAAAYSVLRERHEAAARSLAGLLSSDPAEAQEITADAFTRLHNSLREVSGPKAALRPQLFIAVRWAAYRRLPGQPPGTAGEHADPAPAGAGRDADASQESQEPLFVAPGLADLVRSPLNRAFLSRPERSRAVLWHLDVEQIGPAETAAILGLTQEGVFEFAGEARAGLRQSYRSQYLAETPQEDCASAIAALGTGADGQLTGALEQAVAQHLRACAECGAIVSDLSDLGESLRRVVAPIYLGAAAPTYLQASIGGLHWTLDRPRKANAAPRSRRVLAVACGLLAAAAATGLALILTGTSGPSRNTAADSRPAATGPHSSPAASAPSPPGAAPTTSAPPAVSPTQPPATPSTTPAPAPPSPTTSPSPSPQPTSPGPSPSPTPPPRHHRHHPPPAG
jgi:DNA-directed RNA polymerase specialized sigma24 family protein